MSATISPTHDLILEELAPADCTCRGAPVQGQAYDYPDGLLQPQPRFGHSLTRVVLAGKSPQGEWIEQGTSSNELVVMFGGATPDAKLYGDVWVFQVGTERWMELISQDRALELSAAEKGPIPRSAHVAVAAPRSVTTPFPHTTPGARIYVHGGQVIEVDRASGRHESGSFGELWAFDIWRVSASGEPPVYQTKWSRLLMTTPELFFAANIVIAASETTSPPSGHEHELLLPLPQGYVPILSSHVGCVTESKMVASVARKGTDEAPALIESPTLWLFTGASISQASSSVFAIDLKKKQCYVARLPVRTNVSTKPKAKPQLREMAMAVLTPQSDAMCLFGGRKSSSIKDAHEKDHPVSEDMWLFRFPTHSRFMSVSDASIKDWGWQYLGAGPERMGCAVLSLPKNWLKGVNDIDESKSSSHSDNDAVEIPSAIVLGGRDALMNIPDVLAVCSPVEKDASYWTDSTWVSTLYEGVLKDATSEIRDEFTSGMKAPRCPTCRGPLGWAKVEAGVLPEMCGHIRESKQQSDQNLSTVAKSSQIDQVDVPTDQATDPDTIGPKPNITQVPSLASEDQTDLEFRATWPAMAAFGPLTKVLRVLVFGGVSDEGELQGTSYLHLTPRT